MVEYHQTLITPLKINFSEIFFHAFVDEVIIQKIRVYQGCTRRVNLVTGSNMTPPQRLGLGLGLVFGS